MRDAITYGTLAINLGKGARTVLAAAVDANEHRDAGYIVGDALRSLRFVNLLSPYVLYRVQEIIKHNKLGSARLGLRRKPK